MEKNIIQTIHLFGLLDQHLIGLLKSLDEQDWNKPTLAKKWSVKDIASHLLDGNYRAVSIYRDKYFGEVPPEINSYQDLVHFLNELNGSWVKATKRLSPALLIGLLESSGKQYLEELKKLDPFADAVFSVAWAGENVSKNWFHIAREYTEKYHHQMQIREAVGRTEEIMTRELFHPFIHTMLMGLPHTYRNTAAPEGTTLSIEIGSTAGGQWFLQKENGHWSLKDFKPVGNIISSVSIPSHIAWKLFTKGISADEAKQEVTITGSVELGSTALSMISVMA